MKRLLAVLIATTLISVPCFAKEKASEASETVESSEKSEDSEATDESETSDDSKASDESEAPDESENSEDSKAADDSETSDDSEASDDSEVSISGFRGFEWGTSYKDISKDLDLEDMDKSDYSYNENDDSAVLTLKSATIGGFSTTANFYFLKDELVGGSYDLIFDYTLFNDIISKYTRVYGEPWLDSLNSLAYYPAAMWKDNDNNMVLVAGNDQLFYLSHDSDQTSEEGWGDYYADHYGFNPEVGLQLVENKDNLEGI